MAAQPGPAQLPGTKAGVIAAALREGLQSAVDQGERVGEVGHPKAPPGQVDPVVADLALRLGGRETGQRDVLDRQAADLVALSGDLADVGESQVRLA